MNTFNPFSDKNTSTTPLSAEEQAEYDRLEAEEAERLAAEGQQVIGDGSGDTLPDAKAEENFPIENGAVRWEDAANGGDTSREKQPVYDTPWGRRELSATEVQDFAAQGVTVTRVDAEPVVSLDQEKYDLSKVTLINTETGDQKTTDR